MLISDKLKKIKTKKQQQMQVAIQPASKTAS